MSSVYPNLGPMKDKADGLEVVSLESTSRSGIMLAAITLPLGLRDRGSWMTVKGGETFAHVLARHEVHYPGIPREIIRLLTKVEIPAIVLPL